MRSSLTAACTLVDAHASIKYARMIAMAEVSDSVTASESQPLVAPERGSPSLQRGTGSNGEGEVLPAKRPARKERVTPILALSVAAAVVGSSTQFGFNSGVINSPKQAINNSFWGHAHPNESRFDAPFTSTEMNVAVAIFAIGGMFGALPAGLVADLIGRKYAMLINNIVILVGVGLESFAIHPFLFIAGRFVVGLNSGLNTVLVPLYISEISPVSLRGSMGVFHQMAITTTILLSQVLGLKQILGRPDKDFYGWRILFAFPVLFVVFQLLTLPWCPKSPKYLYIKLKREIAAKRALVRLRGRLDVKDEIKEMQDEYNATESSMKMTDLLEFFTRPSLRRPLLIGIVLHMSQQLSGIVGVLYYSTQIFENAGVQDSDVATVAVGVVLVIFTLILVFIIEKAGRRSLMLYGLGGMVVFFALLTSMFCFQDGFYSNSDLKVTAPGVLLVVSALGITALFALGPGAIPWLMVAELFLQEARPVAVTIATIVNWTANFAVGLAFPYILKNLYPYGTAIFVVTCVLFWLYLYVYLPETKGRSVEDITEEFRKKAGEVQPHEIVKTDAAGT